MDKEEKRKTKNILIDLVKEKNSLLNDLKFINNVLSNRETNVVKNILGLNIDDYIEIKKSIIKNQDENSLKIKEAKSKLILDWLEFKRLKSPLLPEVFLPSLTSLIIQKEYIVSIPLEKLVLVSEANLAIRFEHKHLRTTYNTSFHKVNDSNKHMWRVLQSEVDRNGWRYFLLEEVTTNEVINLDVRIK